MTCVFNFAGYPAPRLSLFAVQQTTSKMSGGIMSNNFLWLGTSIGGCYIPGTELNYTTI